MKTLKNFLVAHKACCDGFEFAKDLTLRQFLETCPRGDWILWLFARTNKNDFAKLTEAKALCANTVRHLMRDGRSTKAVDVALRFAKGEATREELADAADAAADAFHAAYVAAGADAYAADAFAAYVAADADADAYAAAFAAADAAHAAAADDADGKNNQRLTAEICRKVLPLEIWDQSKFK